MVGEEVPLKTSYGCQQIKLNRTHYSNGLFQFIHTIGLLWLNIISLVLSYKTKYSSLIHILIIILSFTGLGLRWMEDNTNLLLVTHEIIPPTIPRVIYLLNDTIRYWITLVK